MELMLEIAEHLNSPKSAWYLSTVIYKMAIMCQIVCVINVKNTYTTESSNVKVYLSSVCLKIETMKPYSNLVDIKHLFRALFTNKPLILNEELLISRKN